MMVIARFFLSCREYDDHTPRLSPLKALLGSDLQDFAPNGTRQQSPLNTLSTQASV
jgi:hypothetical protein